MILFIYLIGVLASFYFTLNVMVRECKSMRGNYWYDAWDGEYTLILILLSAFSWLGLIVVSMFLLFSSEYGIITKSKFGRDFVRKFRKFIEKITF